MRPLAALAALALVPLLASAQPSPAVPALQTPAASSPRLVVAESAIDLGSVREGTSVRAVFTLRNEGDAVLSILRAKPS